MSKVYRQTISDELAAKVEAKRHELGLSIQELTTMALALYCREQTQRRVSPSAPEKETREEYVLSFD